MIGNLESFEGMINNADAIILAGNVIKKYINLPLTDYEIMAEQKFIKNKL